MQSLNAFSAIIRLAVLTVCFTSVLQKADAQGKLVFDSTVLHLGSGVSGGDTLSGIFYFTNTGKEPVTIQKVGVSCDCTVPAWTTGPIAAGQRGQITATYRTGSDTGSFRKQLQVFSDGAEKIIPLTIAGTVTCSMEQNYPCKSGAIRSRQCEPIDFGELLQGKNKEVALQLFNTGTRPLQLTHSNCLLPFIRVILPEEEIPAEAAFTVTVHAAPNDRQQVGLYQDSIAITVPGQEAITLPVTVRIMERFATVTRQRAQYPPLDIPKAMLTLGDVKAGESVNATFEWQNVGTVPSKIRSYDAGGSNATSISFDKKITRSGETQKMKIIFNTEGKSGQWTEMIYVHTNLPEMPLLRFSLQMNIIRP
jgi:Protein of unknown function (DUF1573)